GLEGRRVVALDAIEDLELRRRRVDLARRRDAVGVVALELLPADLEDRVGIEPIECAKVDQLGVPLPPDRPVAGSAGEDVVQPLDLVVDGALRPLDGSVEAAPLGCGYSLAGELAGREDLVEEPRDVAARVE